MDFKALKWQIIRGSLARKLLLKALMFTIAMVIVSYIQIADDARKMEPLTLNFNGCHPLNLGLNKHLNFTGFMKPVSAFAFRLIGAVTKPCKENGDLIISVFKELMEKDLLDSRARSLCLGEGSAWAVSVLQELGLSRTFGAERHPFFSLLQRRFVYELDFKDNYFDFVFSRDLDRVSVPALLVLEVERVLRPGGTGAMLVGAPNFYSGSLIRVATPVSSFLKSSNIVHICSVGSFSLVIFKKKFDTVGLFEHYRLPSNCPSITNNKPVMKYIEPLVEENSIQVEKELSYLPKFMNISSRNRLIYINIGAGELVSSSVTNMFQPNYPIPPQDFNVYVVDHNTSALSSYVKKPGITFVYHPGLDGDEIAPNLVLDEYYSSPLDEEGFDFISWFKQTKKGGDFVVLMMNAKEVELNILFELFKTGEICHVDELFLRCSNDIHCKSAVCGDCESLLKGLRNGGVFVHQWLGN